MPWEKWIGPDEKEEMNELSKKLENWLVDEKKKKEGPNSLENLRIRQEIPDSERLKKKKCK